MKSLGELQRQFQHYVLAGDAAIARSINESSQTPAARRLSIYSDAYRLRLSEALASNFPRVQQLLGEEAFASIARRYIDDHPSPFRSLRWYGRTLPAFLARLHAEQPWLADLAEWEWMIATAFDARDASPIDGEALGRVAPDQWPGLQFEFHPSLQRIAMITNAPTLFKALGEDQPVPMPQVLEREQPWLIWRQELKTNYRSLSDVEAELLDLLVSGGCFETLCDGLCATCEPAEIPLKAATLLKGWIADGLVVGVRHERSES